MTTGSAASKLLINFSACSFLWSWACVKIASRWNTERPSTSWAVARVNALRDFFTGDVLNLHFLAADSFRYGRRRGLNENANACWPSRRKHSRTHGGHRDGTNGGMTRTFTVDCGWPLLSRMLATRACASTGTIRSLMVLKQMYPSQIFVCPRKVEKYYFLEYYRLCFMLSKVVGRRLQQHGVCIFA